MATIYQVVDDREGMNDVVATYDNEDAAEQHRVALAATDDIYGDYFLVEPREVESSFSASSSFNGLD